MPDRQGEIAIDWSSNAWGEVNDDSYKDVHGYYYPGLDIGSGVGLDEVVRFSLQASDSMKVLPPLLIALSG